MILGKVSRRRRINVNRKLTPYFCEVVVFYYLCYCSIIFELIKGEMAYVKDLENIEIVRLLSPRKKKNNT